MKPLLKRKTNTYYFIDYNDDKIFDKPNGVTGDLTDITGNLTDITGDLTDITGNLTDITGNLTDITGDLTDITGNIDDCEITDEERKKGINITDLIQ